MRENNPRWAKNVRTVLEKYKYVFLVILVGVLLLLLPNFSGAQKAARTAPSAEQSFDLEGMERKIETALSEVEGAGRVRVVLALKGGPKQILAQDGKRSEQGNEVSTVVLSRGSGTEEAVQLQELAPQFQGALVVCSGGDNPEVRLAVANAMAALTGLGSNRISICKGK